MSLITIAQAKAHLRIDTDSLIPSDAADADLLLKMAQAEHLILDYLKTPMTSPPYWVDETDVPPLVQAAILFQLGELYRFRGDDDGKADRATDGSLSPMIEGMLRRYRDPALA
jgi:hypothetical protein